MVKFSLAVEAQTTTGHTPPASFIKFITTPAPSCGILSANP
ncbi:hypothetical protein [Ancylothrix sp. D3o]|nr:hypothetical protein [Ancylothrix sp. D3o]